jgi:hypothetical protein
MATSQHQKIIEMLDESDILSSASLADSLIPDEITYPDTEDVLPLPTQDPNIIESNLDLDSVASKLQKPKKNYQGAGPKCPEGFVGRYPYCERPSSSTGNPSRMPQKQESVFGCFGSNPGYAIVGTVVVVIAVALVYKWSRGRNE